MLAAAPTAPVAYLGSGYHGLFVLLAARDGVVKLDASELGTWSAAHPGGILLVDPEDKPVPMPAELECVAHDTVHRSPVEIWRAGA